MDKDFISVQRLETSLYEHTPGESDEGYVSNSQQPHKRPHVVLAGGFNAALPSPRLGPPPRHHGRHVGFQRGQAVAGFVPVGERPQPLVVHERARGRQKEAEKGSANEVDAARPEEVEPLGGRGAIGKRWGGRGGEIIGTRISFADKTRNRTAPLCSCFHVPGGGLFPISSHGLDCIVYSVARGVARQERAGVCLVLSLTETTTA